ncbi:MAG: YihY family inner membrane protein [Rhodocyclaceae bacterium]|nr:YihY family inner membrane protein [Rhodocyclaceae bacterium]
MEPLRATRDFFALMAQRFQDVQCPQVAGSLTYTTLLALVPLLAVTLALFSKFPAFSELGEALGTFLQSNVLPPAASQIVTTYALQFSEKAAGLTLFGTFGLIITTLLLLGTIEKVLNAIWGVHQLRPWLTRMMIYWVVLSLGPLALGGSVYATSRLAAQTVGMIGQQAGEGFSILMATLMPVCLLGLLFAFLYFSVPNARVRISHALIGGLAAGAGFVFMQQAFAHFLAKFPTYTLIYGTFAVLPIFLVWLYLSWLVVLLGALITAALPSFFERRAIAPQVPGQEVWCAINMLCALASVRLGTGGALSFEALYAQAGASRDATGAILEDMRNYGWVARTDEQGWVLAIAPEVLRLREIVARFALDAAHWQALPRPCGGVLAARRIQQALEAQDCTLQELSLWAAQDAGAKEGEDAEAAADTDAPPADAQENGLREGDGHLASFPESD